MDGWVHYTHLFSARLSLRGKHHRTLQGIKNSDGSCTMSDSGTVAAGGMGQYSEPLAVNSDLCQEILLTGTLTQASAAQLAAANAALSDVRDVSSAFGFAPARVKSAPAQALGATTVTSSAYSGSRWVDPAYVVITALTNDLSWQRTGTAVPSASYTIKPYEFAYDGWYNSWTPHPPFNWGPGYVSITSSETFTNVDFEALLLSLSIAFGGWSTVYAACGSDVSPAVFTHTETTRGKADGSVSWSWSDTKKGGCSSLVHHDSYAGYGSF